MSELILPGGLNAKSFDRRFFLDEFGAPEKSPQCELMATGDVPVVELELVNGRTCDVFCFVEFRRELLVAELFVDPPKCDRYYRSYIRFESIFRVNIRSYKSAERKLGFKPQQPAVLEDR